MKKPLVLAASAAIILCGSVFAYNTIMDQATGTGNLAARSASSPVSSLPATAPGQSILAANSVTPPASGAPSSDPLDDICPRAPAGSFVANPPDAVTNSDGFIHLTARNIGTGPEDDLGTPNYNYRFCLLNNGQNTRQSPVLRLVPGQTLKLALSDRLQPFSGFPTPHIMVAPGQTPCLPQPDALAGTIAITNLHFHGMNVTPTCGGDEVINTFLAPPGNGGATDFHYVFKIPANEPPGLYWYHPHIHGISQEQLLGGMTGVMVVAGMEKFFPEVASLKERIFVLRDSDKPNPADNPQASPDEPWKDVSINYVPVAWNNGAPSPVPQIAVAAGERQFWRIANAAADTHFVLKLQFRNGPGSPWQDQPLEILARDGVPVTSDDGAAHGALLTKQAVLPPGARVEFIMTAPAAGVEARLLSDDYNRYLLDTNPNPAHFDATDRNPPRVLAQLQAAPSTARTVLVNTARPKPTEALHRFAGLRNPAHVRQRTLFFTKSDTDFFITQEGNIPKPFHMDAPPDIVVNMPAVEEWTIENRDNESHDFHIHQVHFRVVEINGRRTDDLAETTMRDTIELPPCRDWGTADPNNPYANDPQYLGKNCRVPYRVKVRMDFRDKDIAGILVYHCHILEHEDKGMMAKIQLVWNPVAAAQQAQADTQQGRQTLANSDARATRPASAHTIRIAWSDWRVWFDKAAALARAFLPQARSTGMTDRFGRPVKVAICSRNHPATPVPPRRL